MGRPGSSFPEGMVRAREFRLRQDPGLLECSRVVLLILIIMIRVKVRMTIVSAIIKCFNSATLCTKPLHQFDARPAQAMGCAVWGDCAFYRKALSMSGSMSKKKDLWPTGLTVIVLLFSDWFTKDLGRNVRFLVFF